MSRSNERNTKGAVQSHMLLPETMNEPGRNSSAVAIFVLNPLKRSRDKATGLHAFNVQCIEDQLVR